MQCMQAAVSVDHRETLQSDTGGWGRVPSGWGRVTGGWGGNTNGRSDVTVGGWGHRRVG